MQTALEYYACAGQITEVGEVFYLSHLPATISDLCQLIQGVLLHPFEAHRYGVKVARKRWQELDLCEVTCMLRRLWELHPAPLEVP